MTSDPTPLDIVSDPSAIDPLSDVTRGERKALLGSCVVAVSIAAGGLVPEEIDALGITVTAAQEKSLLYILTGVIVYFVFGFTIYAFSDLNRRRVATAQARGRVAPIIDDAVRIYKKAEEDWKGRGEDMAGLFEDERFKRMAALSEQMKMAQKVSSVGTLRIVFDVWLPIVIGVASSVIVLSRTRGFPGWPWVMGVTVSATVISIAFQVWKRRNAIEDSWRRRRSKWRRWRMKRFMERASRLSDGHPKKEKLLAKARESLMKSIEDFAPKKKP